MCENKIMGGGGESMDIKLLNEVQKQNMSI